ncbi:hypothetical protein FHW16_005409 [Phyllobacterium myrsinacearum]|uniref:Uncharacterized protein n=2 Tax=Phyllobacterium myrsinacearum TaxID=28101 RepID=A0A839EVX4_9HYPH|nr:hypothetical protein [Phyllobacterium myrsinacearum]
MKQQYNEAEIAARFICVDCSVDTCESNEYYMVQDAVWKEAGMTPDGGMLCLGCLEDRLKRQLKPHDFPDYPINHGVFPRFDRMMNRLGYRRAA